jgi:hypothetical protein
MAKKKLSYDGLWGSNPQDFIKLAQSRKMFHLEAVKTVIMKLEWMQTDKVCSSYCFLFTRIVVLVG